ncbi:hypothetical protein GWK47_004647 [Chionoecetes opilio]|uniref:Uncharacterized protein n=1 Tax=Chionoecetes opilio TaxID=41210 RepID=A0A8J4YL51_CHIOP|nr:hypothetical protein GWK47_004647 [Chionoecetes opilio]
MYCLRLALIFQKRKRQPMEDTIEVMVGLQNISSFSEDLIKPECPANTGEMSMNSRDISAISAAVWRPSHETTPLNPPNPSFSTHETPPTPSEIEAKAVLDGPSLQEEYDPLFIIPEVFIKVEDRSDFEPTVIPAVTLMVEESLKPEPDMGTTIKSEID